MRLTDLILRKEIARLCHSRDAFSASTSAHLLAIARKITEADRNLPLQTFSDTIIKPHLGLK